LNSLYYYYYDSKFIVSSRLQSILTQIEKIEIDYRAINNILAYGYTKKPIYQNIN